MKAKTVIWGTGSVELRLEKYFCYEKMELAAFIDDKLAGKHKQVLVENHIEKIPILSSEQLNDLSYDICLIASSFYVEIMQRIAEMGLLDERVVEAYTERALCDERIKNILRPEIYLTTDEPIINGVKLQTNSGHMLCANQKNHLMYDRIFPWLSRYSQMRGSGWVIDIGANIGDSLIAMATNSDSFYLGIEPEGEFYELLKTNTDSFVEKNPHFRNHIQIERAFVSENEMNTYKTDKNAGTASKVEVDKSKADAPTYTLTHLCTRYKMKPQEIRLIKIDTDGYDADCILSCGDMLKETDAFIYWENEINHFDQAEKYRRAVDYLEKCGYTKFYLFDNYGNYMYSGDGRVVHDIIDYLLRILNGWGYRTFYYVDILAVKANRTEDVGNMLSDYLSRFFVHVVD